MVGPGGSIVRGIIDDVRKRVDAYLGQLAQIREGLTPEKPVMKPAELVEYELIQDFGLAWQAGGLDDQPWLNLRIYLAVQAEVRTHEMIQRANQNAS